MKKLPRELKLIPTDPDLSFIDRAKSISFRKGYILGMQDKGKMNKKEARRLDKIYNLTSKLSDLI